MWFGLLPNRIVVYRFDPNPLCTYTRRALGVAGFCAGGLWLALDIWVPNQMTDRAGWAIVVASAIAAAGLVASAWRGALKRD